MECYLLIFDNIYVIAISFVTLFVMENLDFRTLNPQNERMKVMGKENPARIHGHKIMYKIYSEKCLHIFF